MSEDRERIGAAEEALVDEVHGHALADGSEAGADDGVQGHALLEGRRADARSDEPASG